MPVYLCDQRHRVHSFYPLFSKGAKLISKFCRIKRGFKELFWMGLDGKGVVNFWRGCQGFSRYQIKMFFHDSNLTCYLRSD